jgi:hypothetical protein
MGIIACLRKNGQHSGICVIHLDRRAAVLAVTLEGITGTWPELMPEIP